MIEWVTVKGYDESFDDDLWAESRHQVFRKVQDHTHSAMLHFYSPTLPDLAVKFFMVNIWCRLCRNLATNFILILRKHLINTFNLFRHQMNVMIHWTFRTKTFLYIVLGLVAQLSETLQRPVQKVWQSSTEFISTNLERFSNTWTVPWRMQIISIHLRK